MIFRKLHSIKICFTVNSWSPSHWKHNGGWGLFSILNECVKYDAEEKEHCDDDVDDNEGDDAGDESNDCYGDYIFVLLVRLYNVVRFIFSNIKIIK